jgi:hypothetical protein
LSVVAAESTPIVCTGLTENNLDLLAVNRFALREIGMNDRAGGKGRKDSKRDETGDLHVEGLKF